MKRLYAIALWALWILLCSAVAVAQQPPQPAVPDPNAPTLTLEEKIALTTDEVKKQDILERLQKQYIAEIKPIQDHEDAAKTAIEQEHPGWVVTQGPQGWGFTKKPEPAKPAAPKPAETPKPTKPPTK